MLIRYGFKIDIYSASPLTMIAMLAVHPARRGDVVTDTGVRANALSADGHLVPAVSYTDGFGNRCERIDAPAGGVRLTGSGLIHDSGLPDDANINAHEHPVNDLPPSALLYLLGSRYCPTDLLCDEAWRLFGSVAPGWPRVQAVCDFVHRHLQFDYGRASSTRTARQAFADQVGVCRDFAHLAITLCRCLNIPARYCTGYLGDIGVPADPNPMDFSAWFEVYLGGRWWTFDARHNTPRIGRILLARGRDATDVAIVTTFGSHQLTHFEVLTDIADNVAASCLAA